MIDKGGIRRSRQIKIELLLLVQFFWLAFLVSPSFSREGHPHSDGTGRYAGQYICTPVASAGFIYQEREGWRGMGDLINEQRVFLNIEALSRERFSRFYMGQWNEYYVMNYSINIKIADPEDIDLPCYDKYEINAMNIIDTIHIAGTLSCSHAFYEYRFNLSTLRYTEKFLGGYIFSDRSGIGPPYISIGTCTKHDD